MQSLHLKRNSVWHEFHFLYLFFLSIYLHVINLFVNKFEADLCLIRIDKIIEITSKRFALIYFLRGISATDIKSVAT